MLKKRQRLSKAEFDTLLKKGRRIHGENVSIVFFPCPTKKFGVVVSKKTARKAPQRNLVRRRVYAALEEALDTIPAGFLGVLTRKKVPQLPYRELQEELQTLLKKL